VQGETTTTTAPVSTTSTLSSSTTQPPAPLFVADGPLTDYQTAVLVMLALGLAGLWAMVGRSLTRGRTGDNG